MTCTGGTCTPCPAPCSAALRLAPRRPIYRPGTAGRGAAAACAGACTMRRRSMCRVWAALLAQVRGSAHNALGAACKGRGASALTQRRARGAARVQGEEVSAPMLDCVVAACCQMGDTARMLETFEAYAALGLTAGAQAYNACIAGFIRHNLLDRLPFVRARPPVPPARRARRHGGGRASRTMREAPLRRWRAPLNQRPAVPAQVTGCTRASGAALVLLPRCRQRTFHQGLTAGWRPARWGRSPAPTRAAPRARADPGGHAGAGRGVECGHA